MLTEALDRALEATQSFRPRSGFYVTDLGKCLRRVAYDFREDIPGPPLTARKLRIFREGKELEENLAEEFQLLDWRYIREVPLRSDFISGRADFLLEDPFPTILEAKTTGPYSWAKLSRPFREHILQLCFYLSRTDLETGILLYENKGTQERREFQVNLPDYWDDLDSAIARLESLTGMDFYRELPPRAYNKSDFHCRNCDYSETCWQGVPDTQSVDVPNNIQEVVLDYLIAKEDEEKAKKRVSDLQALLHAYFEKNGNDRLVTDLGTLIRQKRETITFDLVLIKAILEPLGYWEKVIKVDSQAVKSLLHKGSLTEQEIEKAKITKSTYALVISKTEGGDSR